MRKADFLKVDTLLAAIALLTIAYSAYLALAFSGQPPLDVHSFRQAQTALSSYWYTEEGFKFSYETPVAGVPWSIPLEFPIYQILVSWTSEIFGSSLDSTGRILSYIFLVLCLAPVRSITNRLQLPGSVFLIFSAMLLSAPIYVYWGRTFMIETAALFFAVVAIKYFIDALFDDFSVKTIFLYVLFITLSILQKATTALPILALLSIVYLYFEVRRAGSIGRVVFGKSAFIALACFVIPLAIGFAWVTYTDHIKSLNPLGAQLTSSALSRWNWGTLAQRFSSDLYIKVLWERMFVTNVAGILGLLLLVGPFFSKVDNRLKIIILFSAALGIVPLLLFTNLHIIHDYYQTASIIFLIYAVSVSLGTVVLTVYGKWASISLLLLILFSNYHALFAGYRTNIKEVFDKGNRDFAVGEILKREIPEGGQFVAFGNDWSSTFAYMSQRKSFTVPVWFSEYEHVKFKPEDYVEKNRIGAVVSCSENALTFTELFSWSDKRSWKIGEVHGCYIAVPEKSISGDNFDQVQCKGSIDVAAIEERYDQRVIVFAGWSTTSSEQGEIPEQIYVTLSAPGKDRVYFDTLKVPRLDVSAHLGISTEIDAGFSRVIPASLEPGIYVVGIAQTGVDQIELCQFQKKLVVD